MTLQLHAPTILRRGGDRSGRPVALVYRGPAALPGCPEAVKDLLEASRWGFDVRYTGPDEQIPLTARTLGAATIYAQPGGGTLDAAYSHLADSRDTIRDFVAAGGRYLGFCLGGYLAGATPGFDLLPGDTDRYISSRGATIQSQDDVTVDVRWRGRRRSLFFQDGPHFDLDPDRGTQILATYPNHTIAAAVVAFDAGYVGVVGPHPEAGSDWFVDANLRDPGAHSLRPHTARGRDLGLDLINTVMKR